MALLALALSCACSDSVPPQGPTDAATAPDAEVVPDAGPDGGTAADFCTCDTVEDCHGCYAHIGQCCYADPTIFGHIDELVANCEAHAACAACCNECLAKSCDELKASNDCPAE